MDRHIIWDWNGTLLDDVNACVEALNVMLARRGRPAVSRERYRESFGFPVRDSYRAWGLDPDGGDWDGMAREYHDLYARTSGGASLRPGARDALDALRAAGVGMSVLSSCEQSLLEAMLARHGIGAYFGLVRGQDNLYGGSKLDAGRRLVRALGAAAAHAVLVGDTTHDFDVAASLGCGCVLLTGGHQSRERLLRCDCPVMDDVGELLNPADGSEPWAC